MFLNFSGLRMFLTLALTILIGNGMAFSELCNFEEVKKYGETVDFPIDKEGRPKTAGEPTAYLEVYHKSLGMVATRVWGRQKTLVKSGGANTDYYPGGWSKTEEGRQTTCQVRYYYGSFQKTIWRPEQRTVFNPVKYKTRTKIIHVPEKAWCFEDSLWKPCK